jgi:CRP-like cAMP-binding protein
MQWNGNDIFKDPDCYPNCTISGNTLTPSGSSNRTCSSCGEHCVEAVGGVTSEGFDSMTTIAMVLACVVGFILGTLITATVMVLTFQHNQTSLVLKQENSKKRKKRVLPQKKRNNKQTDFNMEIKMNESTTDDANTIFEESEMAKNAHDAKIKRKETKSIQSTNARLAIRKQQLEMKIKRADALSSVDLFKKLSTRNKDMLIKKMKLKVYEENEKLCVQGEQAKHFYIIAHLENKDSYVNITGRGGDDVVDDDDDIELRRLGLFDYLGENALNDGVSLRTASATVVGGNVEVLSLTKSSWNELIECGILSEDIKNNLLENAKQYQTEQSKRSDVVELNNDGDKNMETIVELSDY